MKKTYLLIFILALSIVISSFNSLQINATNEIIEENPNENEIINEVDAFTRSSGEGWGHPDNHGEQWYNLSITEPVFGNNPSIDYDRLPELLTYLKPGDIIYETNDSIVGDITGHIAIVYDVLWDEGKQQYYVSIIEAYTDGVAYGIMTPYRFEEKDVIIYRLTNASETQIQTALNWLVGKCGDKFSFHPSKYRDGLPILGETYWYCAELIWAAFMEVNIYLDIDDNNDGGTNVLPYELASNPQLTTILHYTDKEDEDRYKTILTNNGNIGHTYSCDGDTYTEAHTLVYTSNGEQTHSISCICGYTITENHDLIYTNNGGPSHEVACRDCDYDNRIAHNLEYSDNGNTTHRVACIDCSYTGTLPHNYICNGVVDGRHYEICTECGHEHNGLTNANFTSLGASGHSAECKECAYEITSTSHTLEYITLGDTYHTQRCKYCNYVGARQQHILQLTGGVGNYKKCQICGAMVPVSGGGGIFPVEPTKKEDDPEEETEKF